MHFIKGGSIVIHSFGAYFGLAVAWCLKPLDTLALDKDSATATSDLFSFLGIAMDYNVKQKSNLLTFLLGTLVLWVFWPSFNSLGDKGLARSRSQANTYLSLIGSTLATFAISNVASK
jgi:ammonium transporter Rh